MIALCPSGRIVAQFSFHRIEDFALPGEEIDEARDVLRDVGAGSDDRRPFAFALRDFAGGTLAKNLIELIA